MPKKKDPEVRYFKTDIVNIPIIKLYKKSDAYRQATEDGWGTVYIPYENGEPTTLICDEDCSATLINKYGQEYCISSCEELKPKEWYKQAECNAIITTDSCGSTFWEKEDGLIKIYVTYDENGFINTYRLANWTEKPYDEEIEIKFEKLPLED